MSFIKTCYHNYLRCQQPWERNLKVDYIYVFRLFKVFYKRWKKGVENNDSLNFQSNFFESFSKQTYAYLNIKEKEVIDKYFSKFILGNK